MLLTDGSPNTTEDLRAYESAILGVSNAETIDLAVKLSLATAEIHADVMDFLLDHAGADPHAAARRSIGTTDVVITQQIRRWHAVHTLEIVYRDAFHNQLNDRYQAKFLEYREQSRRARTLSFHFGVGLALSPIPEAPPPLFNAGAGTIPASTYYARVSWVAASGQEGEPSEMSAYLSPAGSVPVVSLPGPQAAATGFNVYMGLSPDGLTLQNATPVALDQSFTLPGSGIIAGRGPGAGQAPDLYISGGWTLRRG